VTGSDEQIARTLLHAHYILDAHFAVWLRQHHGETIYSLRHDYPHTSPSTLYQWVHKVNQAIADARMIEAPTEPEPSPWGVTVAISHHTHLAQDGTPQGKPLKSLFPDAERMKAYGKKPR
jgi:hypothetical protein